MSTAAPFRRALGLAVIVPLLGGCFVTSQNPVLRPGETGRDPELRGLWVSKEGREFLHILRPDLKDGRDAAKEAPGFSGLYVISEGRDAADRDGWARVQIITTQVKERKILSMRFREGQSGGDLEDIEGWLIFTYDLRDGRFHLHMIKEEPVNTAIEAGKLAGRPKSGSGSDPHVTASAGEWVAFLESADLESLFDRDEDSFLVSLSADRIRKLTGEGETANGSGP